jgi:hypothetical protein
VAQPALLWTANSDYVVAPHNWFPSFNPADRDQRVYARLWRQRATAMTWIRPQHHQTAVFYGAAVYDAARARLDPP